MEASIEYIVCGSLMNALIQFGKTSVWFFIHYVSYWCPRRRKRHKSAYVNWITFDLLLKLIHSIDFTWFNFVSLFAVFVCCAKCVSDYSIIVVVVVCGNVKAVMNTVSGLLICNKCICVLMDDWSFRWWEKNKLLLMMMMMMITPCGNWPLFLLFKNAYFRSFMKLICFVKFYVLQNTKCNSVCLLFYLILISKKLTKNKEDLLVIQKLKNLMWTFW